MCRSTVSLILCFSILTSWSDLRAQDQAVTVSVQQLTDSRSSDPADSRLSVTFKVEGAAVKNAFEFGSVQIEEPMSVAGKLIAADPEGFAALKRTGFADRMNEALLTFELSSPLRQQTSFPLLSGTLKLKTYRQQLIPVEKVLARRNETLTDPLLSAHDVVVRIVDPRQAFPGLKDELEVAKLLASSVAFEVTGNTRKINSFLLETAEGKKIPTMAGSFGAGRMLLLSQRSTEPLPPDVVAKILIPVAPELITVPFRFENLMLP